MSLLRQMNQCFIILLVIIFANAESDQSATINNLQENSDVSTDVALSELTGDVKRNQRSFFKHLFKDLFDDCNCNNCNCNSNNYHDNYNDHGVNGLPSLDIWKKPLKKVFKKPLFGLFGSECEGNCRNNQVHYHHGYNENNYNPSPAPVKYEEPAPVYERPQYQEPAPVYEKPKYHEPAPVYDKPKYEEPVPVYDRPQYEGPEPVYEEPRYEEPAPVYEKPATVYKTPIYEAPQKSYDCGSSKCAPQPQLVYQPIIYVAPAGAQSHESSSEEDESKDEKEEKCEEPTKFEENYENNEQYEQKTTYEKTEHEKKKCENENSEEEKEDKKKEHKTYSPTPIVPTYSPCSHGCGAPSPHSFPAYNYAMPQSAPLHQIINYNGLVPNYGSVTPNYAGVGYGAYPSAPISPAYSQQGCGHHSYAPAVNYIVVPGHSTSHNSVDRHTAAYPSHHYASAYGMYHQYPPARYMEPYVLNHHDQPYSACPELFTAYNDHLAHLSSPHLTSTHFM